MKTYFRILLMTIILIITNSIDIKNSSLINDSQNLFISTTKNDTTIDINQNNIPKYYKLNNQNSFKDLVPIIVFGIMFICLLCILLASCCNK